MLTASGAVSDRVDGLTLGADDYLGKPFAFSGGAVVSAETLLEKVWDENADPFTNAARITVGTLRRNLGDPPIIDTVTGAGYRLAAWAAG